MVEIFKTDISNYFDALTLKELLSKEFPKATITIDLQSNDKLLRIEGVNIPESRVIQIIKHEGFYCRLIEDARNIPSK